MPNPTLYDNFSQVRQYIDQNQVDLSSYVTKDELNGMSYATTSQLPVVDENIIPKANNTYTLGNANNQYAATYAYIYNLGPENSWERQNNWQTRIKIDGSVKYYLNSNRFMPNTSGISLGASTNEWAYTYTKNLILDGSDVNNVFPTYAYVADYVDQHGGGGSTVIDENIIPKANNTYTLGNANNQYATVYTYNINLNQSQIKQDEYSIGFNVNGNNTMRMFVGSFRPWVDKGATLGSSSTQWSTTYTYNLYSPSLVLSYSYNSIDNASNTQINFKVNKWNRMKLTNTALMPSTNNGIGLGDSSTQWASTYVRNLYLNGTNIESRFDNLIWTGTADQYEALSDYTTYQIYMIKES